MKFLRRQYGLEITWSFDNHCTCLRYWIYLWKIGENMKAYPTVKDTPNRKQRKSQRRKIFEENRLGDGARRKRSELRAPGRKK